MTYILESLFYYFPKLFKKHQNRSFLHAKRIQNIENFG
jgi:hypothetical protein